MSVHSLHHHIPLLLSGKKQEAQESKAQALSLGSFMRQEEESQSGWVSVHRPFTTAPTLTSMDGLADFPISVIHGVLTNVTELLCGCSSGQPKVPVPKDLMF